MPITDTRVLVVEDDAFTRTTVCDALRYHDVEIVGQVGTATEAMALARNPELTIDAALLDLERQLVGACGHRAELSLRSVDPRSERI